MNNFPKAPNDRGANSGGLDATKVAWIIEDDGTAGGLFRGRYFKAGQWTRAADRGLIFDGIHNGGYWTNTTWNHNGWPYVPVTNVALPKFPHYQMPFDWNRHGKTAGLVKSTDKSMNMLFCDGHATPVSAREAYQAIRFR
jgi:prepilin-type processing-associated H-X9-DG protein